VSDDGLVTTNLIDTNGDGINERRTVDTTALQTTGTITREIDLYSANNTFLGFDYRSVSDDGLTLAHSVGVDGDGYGDWIESTSTTINADGSTSTSTAYYDVNSFTYGYALRGYTLSTVSDDGRNISLGQDLNGDSIFDRFTTRLEQDNGAVVTTVSEKNADGTLQSKFETSVSGNGLIATSKSDLNGDGLYDFTTTDTRILNANGSITDTIARASQNGVVYEQDVFTRSDDGLVVTKTQDFENNGVIDRTTTSTTTLNLNGSTTSTTLVKSSSNATIFSDVVNISADKKTVTETVDRDGNGVADWSSTATLGANGDTTFIKTFYSKGGAQDGKETTIQSFDGLSTVTSTAMAALKSPTMTRVFWVKMAPQQKPC
jgi:trimeric autotransporter adhesin